MIHFYIHWKQQKTFVSWAFSGGVEIKHWRQILSSPYFPWLSWSTLVKVGSKFPHDLLKCIKTILKVSFSGVMETDVFVIVFDTIQWIVNIGGSRDAATSKMERFGVIVSAWKPY